MLNTRHAALLRVALVITYPLLAHLATHQRSGVLAALALTDLALVVLLRALLQRRGWAWVLLVVLLAGLWWLAQSPYALMPLLLVPVVLIGLVAYGFGRTLRPGQVPLISRIVAALDAMPAALLSPELRRYTRRLTAAWALLLAVLALLNLVLATLAVPNGLLAGIGIVSPIPIGERQWSWFANILNWGIIAGFFALEFQHRQRRFPNRYHSLHDFLQRMARLGPAFWRDVVR